MKQPRPVRQIETPAYLASLRRMIRAAGRRVGDADEVDLRELIALHDEVDQAVQTAVNGQRALGRSWRWIAAATGHSRQAAWKRWNTTPEQGIPIDTPTSED